MGRLLDFLLQNKIRQNQSSAEFARSSEADRAAAKLAEDNRRAATDRKQEFEATEARLKTETEDRQAIDKANRERGRDALQLNTATNEWSAVPPLQLEQKYGFTPPRDFAVGGPDIASQLPTFDIQGGATPGNFVLGEGQLGANPATTLQSILNGDPRTGVTEIDLSALGDIDPKISALFPDADGNGLAEVPNTMLSVLTTAATREPKVKDPKQITIPDQKTVRDFVQQEFGRSGFDKDGELVRPPSNGDFLNSLGLSTEIDSGILQETQRRIDNRLPGADVPSVIRDAKSGVLGGSLQALLTTDFNQVGADLGLQLGEDTLRFEYDDGNFGDGPLDEALNDLAKREKFEANFAEAVKNGYNDHQLAITLELAGLDEEEIAQQIAFAVALRGGDGEESPTSVLPGYGDEYIGTITNTLPGQGADTGTSGLHQYPDMFQDILNAAYSDNPFVPTQGGEAALGSGQAAPTIELDSSIRTKDGVPRDSLTENAVRAAAVAKKYFDELNISFLVTSTTDSTSSSDSKTRHMVGSKHDHGDAVDISIRGLGGAAAVKSIVDNIRRDLGDDYDVLIDKDHIHIEYDPK